MLVLHLQRRGRKKVSAFCVKKRFSNNERRLRFYLKPFIDTEFHIGYSRRVPFRLSRFYICGIYNQSFIVNICLSSFYLKSGSFFLREIARFRGLVLFVCNGPVVFVRTTIATLASRCFQCFIIRRWRTGTLLTFRRFKRYRRRVFGFLFKIRKLEREQIALCFLSAQFTVPLQRQNYFIGKIFWRLKSEIFRLYFRYVHSKFWLHSYSKYVRGCRSLRRLPDAICIASGCYDFIAYSESRILGIPTLSGVNTEQNFVGSFFPHFGNDDHAACAVLLFRFWSDSIFNGLRSERLLYKRQFVSWSRVLRMRKLVFRAFPEALLRAPALSSYFSSIWTNGKNK